MRAWSGRLTQPTMSRWKHSAFLLWIISSRACGTRALSSHRFRDVALMLIMKAISSDRWKKKRKPFIIWQTDEEKSCRFLRVIARYSRIRRALSRDRRLVNRKRDSIRFYTIWFCTITRMNRRNLMSLRERARPPPRARSYTCAYWRRIFSREINQPGWIQRCCISHPNAIRRRRRRRRQPLCSSPIPFTTPSISYLTGRKAKYVNESRRMRVDRIAAYTYRRCTNRWEFIGYSYIGPIFSLPPISSPDIPSNILVRSYSRTMHHAETVVSLDSLDRLNLPYRWNVVSNTIIHSAETLFFFFFFMKIHKLSMRFFTRNYC